jgi:hypothetical protein
VYPFELLFDKMSSNFSFKVGEEVVYVLHRILTTRRDYFQAMLEGSFNEAQVPVSSDAVIPIHGVDVAVFKMIIEWLYKIKFADLMDSQPPSSLI